MCLDVHMMTIHRQLEEARATAQHEMLVAQLRTPWRVTVGRTLERIGRRLAEEPARVQPSLG